MKDNEVSGLTKVNDERYRSPHWRKWYQGLPNYIEFEKTPRRRGRAGIISPRGVYSYIFTGTVYDRPWAKRAACGVPSSTRFIGLRGFA